jgi:hypothetical protein
VPGFCSGERNFEARVQPGVSLHPEHLPLRIILKRYLRVPGSRHLLRRPLDVQEPNARDFDLDLKRGARHAQLSLLISHLRRGRRGLCDAHAVVDVQCASGRAVRTAGRDDKMEVLRAELRRRHRAFRAEWEYGTAADVKRDVGEGNVGQRDALSCTVLGTVYGRERREIVEAVLWEVDRYSRL